MFDGLGSVVALIKYDGSLSGSYTYDPYGKVVKTVGSNNEIIDNAIGFASGTRHDDLTKFGRRWYDPNTGRFTQQDSLSFLANPAIGNRYAYAAGNPVNYVDPTGLAPSAGCIAALGGSVAGALATAAAVATAAAAAPLTLGLSWASRQRAQVRSSPMWRRSSPAQHEHLTGLGLPRPTVGGGRADARARLVDQGVVVGDKAVAMASPAPQLHDRRAGGSREGRASGQPARRSVRSSPVSDRAVAGRSSGRTGSDPPPRRRRSSAGLSRPDTRRGCGRPVADPR
ncbi:RHS repeat-associated core domain-containing protein [Micromonospora sp. M12]